EAPLHRRSRRRDAECAAVDAVEVTPHTQRRQVLVGVVSSLGTEDKVMRSEVATGTDGTRASEHVALVDPCVLVHEGRTFTPDTDETKAEITKEAPGARAVAQIQELEPSVVPARFGRHAERERHAPT